MKATPTCRSDSVDFEWRKGSTVSAAGERSAAKHPAAVLRTRVVAVVREDSDLVAQRAAGDAAVQHRAAIAAWRQPGGHDRSIDEIEAAGAGRLLETERNLELARLNLQPRASAGSSRRRHATGPASSSSRSI